MIQSYQSEQECYLLINGWIKTDKGTWMHEDTLMEFSKDAACDLQKWRDEYKKSPWYRKLYMKVFGE